MTTLKTQPVVRTKPFSDVYISTGNGRLVKVLKKGFDDLGGIEKIVKPGQSVLLKPNLVVGQDPAAGGTTDVRICEAVAELIKAHCKPGTIYVGENTDTGSVTMDAFIRYGYVDMCKRQNAVLVDFTNTERVDVPVPDAMYAEVISIPKLILDVDVFITLCVLKNHDTVCVTGSIKNSFGLVPDDTRRQAHRDNAVEQYLVDIARIRKPDFAVVDGRIGMEGIAGGSHFEHPRFANRIIMGKDPVAVDTVCAHIMVQNPRVRYLQWADEYSLGNNNLDYINIHGMPLEEAKVPFMAPSDQVEEQTGGKIRLHDLGSCSKCRAVTQGILFRFHHPESVLKNVDVAYGSGNWDMPEDPHENCILVGDCVQERYRSLGTWIPGCPMSRDVYFNTLSSLDIVCTKCEQVVNQFVEKHGADELGFVRILASNKTVSQGMLNRAGPTDFLIAVGDCQKRYVNNMHRRGKFELMQMGLEDKYDTYYFIRHIPGHVPSIDELDAALAELKENHAKFKAM